MIFKTQLSGSPHQNPSCHLNTNMYKCPSNPIQAQLSIIRVYLNRQQVWQLANNPSNLAIKDILHYCLQETFPTKASLRVLTKVTQSWSPGLCVVARKSEGAGADRIPKRGCWRAQGCQSRPVSLHLCPPQNRDGAGAEGMNRSWREQQKHLTGFRPKDKHQLRKEFSRTRSRDEHTTTDNSLLLSPFR